MTPSTTPLLYSFRRCPYAIRARMAIWSAGIAVRLEEVALKEKPDAMLALSSKGTVPVLADGDTVLDESLDIMFWALRQNDPDGWYANLAVEEMNNSLTLIQDNDGEFKHWLDRYKYADRYPEYSQEYYRSKCESFLDRLDAILTGQSFLIRNEKTIADIAIFPFIRQFSMVDKEWFDQGPYPALAGWLLSMLEMPLFLQVMEKHK